MANKKWVEEQRLKREERARHIQKQCDNPIIYTHSVTLVDRYYHHKIVLGIMIWVLIALLGAGFLWQAAFVFAYAGKML